MRPNIGRIGSKPSPSCIMLLPCLTWLAPVIHTTLPAKASFGAGPLLSSPPSTYDLHAQVCNCKMRAACFHCKACRLRAANVLLGSTLHLRPETANRVRVPSKTDDSIYQECCNGSSHCPGIDGGHVEEWKECLRSMHMGSSLLLNSSLGSLSLVRHGARQHMLYQERCANAHLRRCKRCRTGHGQPRTSL